MFCAVAVCSALGRFAFCSGEGRKRVLRFVAAKVVSRLFRRFPVSVCLCSCWLSFFVLRPFHNFSIYYVIAGALASFFEEE